MKTPTHVQINLNYALVDYDDGTSEMVSLQKGRQISTDLEKAKAKELAEFYASLPPRTLKDHITDYIILGGILFVVGFLIAAITSGG